MENTRLNSLFDDMADAFSAIVQHPVDVQYGDGWVAFEGGSIDTFQNSILTPSWRNRDPYTGATIDCPTLRIEHFTLIPSKRGQGTGTKIIAKLIESLRKTDIGRVILTAESPRAARFWEHQGFLYIKPRSCHMGRRP